MLLLYKIIQREEDQAQPILKINDWQLVESEIKLTTIGAINYPVQNQTDLYSRIIPSRDKQLDRVDFLMG